MSVSGGGSCRVFGNCLQGARRSSPGSRPTVGREPMRASRRSWRGSRRRARWPGCARRSVRWSATARDLEWVARSSGSTPSAARAALATVKAAASCPATSEALIAGSLSLSQAAEIVRAEAAVPGSEDALLKVAESKGMAGLREEARRVVLGSIDRDELHRRQVAARSVRHWVDGEGMVAGQFRLPPSVGVRFVNRLDAETDRLHRTSRQAGSTEAVRRTPRMRCWRWCRVAGRVVPGGPMSCLCVICVRRRVATPMVMSSVTWSVVVRCR